MGSFDPKAYDPHGSVPVHDHAFAIPGVAELVQLAEALGGGLFPGMGNGQNDTMPNQDSVAPGFPLNLPFVIPQNQVKQQAVKLTFQPAAYRTYISTNPHNHPGDTVANESAHDHAGDTVQNLSISIGNENANHAHGHTHGVNNHQHSMGVTGFTGSADGLYYDTTVGTRFGKANVGPGTLLTDVSGTITPGTDSNAVGQSADHQHTNTSHTHTSTSNTGTGAPHGHTPGTTGNANPADGVHEGTSPDAMHVLVDGADVTTNLGGPFATAQTNLDIGPYVAAGSGIHMVQVTSATNLGRITGWVRNSSIINTLNVA